MGKINYWKYLFFFLIGLFIPGKSGKLFSEAQSACCFGTVNTCDDGSVVCGACPVEEPCEGEDCEYL